MSVQKEKGATMRFCRRAIGAGLLAAATTLTACTGGSSEGSHSGAGPDGDGNGGTLTVLQGSAPDSLDPQFGGTSQSNEADIMVYEPLLTYAAKEGTAGAQLIPALATELPTVSADLLTYSLTLRSGLKYSDGTPVKASDFRHSIERAIKINWANKSFFTTNIEGAAAYDSGQASTITGIQTDDATGAITIHLSNPYGAFANLLAFPAASLVPSDTPMTVLSNTPPVGIGPYTFGKIVPNVSYELVKNPSFADFHIPDIPTGYVDRVDVTVDSNSNTQTQQVLDNQADVFDPDDQIPSGLIGQVQTQAKDRYQSIAVGLNYYFFFNTKVAPFDNIDVRRAVIAATDRTALARLSGGTLIPGCWFLPPTIVGHQDGPCLGIDPKEVPSAATVDAAKQLIKTTGLAGTAVTVWGQQGSPNQEYAAYFSDLLNQLGFQSSLKVVDKSVYWQTIGNQSLNAQTGFDDWNQDFPNPLDFYLQLSAAGISATNNQNYGNVNDPQIESQLAALGRVPAEKLGTVQSDWEKLDTYVAQQAYVNVFGYGALPKFTSARVDFDSTVFNPIYHIEFSTVKFKQ
jgi:peptide/nickel transport system substrate-binding protein